MKSIELEPRAKAGQYPGLFIFTGPSRMMRPVVNLAMNDIELIGTFEQVAIMIMNQICKRDNSPTGLWIMVNQLIYNL